ncbi:MAG: porin [Pseudomonadota bacterium]
MFKRSALTLTLAALLAAPAHADLTINGFASIKAGMTLDSDSTLYGYTDELDFKNESLFAVQVMSDLGEKLSVTAQLMGRGREDFNAEFEWAFLSYQLTDNMQINAGRLRTPFYKYSDFKDVGYAYDWSRVPEAVYNLDFDNIEGVSLYRTATLGSFDSTLQLIAGSFDGDAVVTGLTVQAKIDQILGATWELSRDGISARLAYLTGDTSLSNPDIDALTGILTASGLGAVARAIDVNEESSTFLGLALTLDKNDWVAVAEITRTEVDDSLIAEQNGYYVSVGHRFDSLTPYISYEKRDNDAKRDIIALLPQGVPAQLALGVTQAVERFEVKRDAWNLGLRYDFHPSAAFKAQLTRVNNDITDDDTSLITLGVDLVF